MKKNIFNIISEKLTYLNGGFYSNKTDSRFLVPKEYPGIGWTLNFGNPKAVIMFILMLLIFIGITVSLFYFS